MKGVKSCAGAGALQRRKDCIRLANKRVPMAIDAISSIANLANPKNYKATPEDVEKIEQALLHAVRNMVVKFKSLEESVLLFELRGG